jgi:hypothetical protein
MRGIAAQKFPLTARRAGARCDAFTECTFCNCFGRRFLRAGDDRQNQGNDAAAK